MAKSKVRKQLSAGRPKKATNEAGLPEKEVAPAVQHTGELPKEIIGSHMGQMMVPAKPKGPALPRPPKPAPRGRVAPKF